MPNSVFFVRQCPTCGRRLHIRVEYLGKRVVCPHCHGKLLARDPNVGEVAKADPAEALLRRAEELLETVSEQSAPALKVAHPR